MKCLKPRIAFRPRVENLESRLQPGSVITGSGYGWSILADSLLNQGPLDSQSLVSQSPAVSSRSAQASAPVEAHRDNLEIAIISVAGARSQGSNQPSSTLVDPLAARLTTDDLSNVSLTGHGHSVPLAAVATPTVGQPAPATPIGSVRQSPIGIAAPAPPIAGSTPPASFGNVGHKAAAPAQEVNLDTPTAHAVTGFHLTNEIQAVPLPTNNATRFGGAGNQATLNFLSYLGSSTGPDSINNVVVKNEGGSNFIYVSGSLTDATGRTDAFVAKLADGATSAVWAVTLPITALPGPDVASGLAVNGSTVYVAITATNPASTPQTADAFVASLDATAGTLGPVATLTNASFGAVAIDPSGKVDLAGSVGDTNTGGIDIGFFQVNADLSVTPDDYGAAFAFTLGGNPTNTAVTTGQGLVVDSAGNSYFAGYIGTIGDPNNETLPFMGRFNSTTVTFDWRHAYLNFTHGPGAAARAVAFDPKGNVVVEGSSTNDGSGPDIPGTPGLISQDLFLGRFEQVGGAAQNGGPFDWFADPRTGAFARNGDWTGNGLVVLADGSSIVTGIAYDPSAGTGAGDPASKPTKGIDVHMTHFVATDDNTTQNGDGDPENIFGGTGTDIGLAVALDPTNPTNVYVVGSTTSTDLPTTPGVVQPTTSATTTTGFVGQASVA